MKHCALVEASTGEIKSFLLPAEPEKYPEGSSYGELEVHWEESGLLDSYGTAASSFFYWDENGFQEKPERPSSYYVFNWETKDWDFESEGFNKDVRAHRDAKLGMCDWTQMSDSTLSDDMKNAWRGYRQELRDITDNMSGKDDLTQLDWPEPPQ